MVSDGSIPVGNPSHSGSTSPPVTSVSDGTIIVPSSTTTNSSSSSQVFSPASPSSSTIPAALHLLQSLLSPPYNLSPQAVAEYLSHTTATIPPPLSHSSTAWSPSSFPLPSPASLSSLFPLAATATVMAPLMSAATHHNYPTNPSLPYPHIPHIPPTPNSL